MNDLSYLNDLQDLGEQLDLGPEEGSEGTISQLVQTITEDTYPTSAGSFFACQPLLVDGSETEGAAAAFTPDPARTVYAYNLGTQIPAVSTRLIITAVGGRWVFVYNGNGS